ncbi:MAG: hypothetical protein J1E34_05430 [Oscillospiraceae bacterium]|nr:hypothetical protein [Oscillospiraceae bacterium]
MKTQKLISVILSIVLLVAGLSIGAFSANVPTRSSESATDPANPSEPSTDSANPSEPSTDPANPSEPSTDPANPSEPSTDPANPSEPSTDPANPSEPSTDPATPDLTIDTEIVKEISGIAYAAPYITAEKIIKAAGCVEKILKADETELENDKYVGSGMTLVKTDGTKLTVVVKGDNDSDGKITAADARFALRASVNLETPNDWKANASEVDGEEKITAADARLILRASVNLETLDLY